MSADKSNDSPELDITLVSLGLRGGLTQYTAMLANNLPSNIEVTVVMPESKEVENLLNDEVNLHKMKFSQGEHGRIEWFIRNLCAFFWVQYRVWESDPDVVHYPFVDGIVSSITTIITCLYQDTVIGTIHDPDTHTGMEIKLFGFNLLSKMNKATTLFLDRVIVHGEECRKQAGEHGYPMDKIRVLPHGLYSHFKTENDSTSIEPNTILFFGKIRPNKGFDRIPEILDKVSEEVPDVRAVVAGSSDVAPQIDSDVIESTISDLEQHDKVILDNRYIPNEEVPTYFKKSAAVVLPYYEGTMSGVAMIAYTFATPIVATRFGEIEGIIEEDCSGLLASSNSSDELADKIAVLLRDHTLREKIRDNIKKSRGKYDWETIGDKTVSIYRDALGL